MFNVEPTGQPKIPENFLKQVPKDDLGGINLLFGNNITASLKDLKSDSNSIFTD